MSKSTANSLADAIGEVERKIASQGNAQKTIVDIMTFCDDPEYLSLPNSNFNLYLSQRVILKTFYMGTRGNENLKLTKEEWGWLYSKMGKDVKGDMAYERNIEQVIEKLQEKEKAQAQALIDNDKDAYDNHNFRELLLVLGRRSSKTILSSIITSYEV